MARSDRRIDLDANGVRLGPHRHCHSAGYAMPCKPGHLMCAYHWRLVPAGLRAAVSRDDRLGQCDDKRPSTQWSHAATAAIRAVAVRGHVQQRQFTLLFGGRAYASEKVARRGRAPTRVNPHVNPDKMLIGRDKS